MVYYRARLDYFISVAVVIVCTAVSIPFRNKLEVTDFAMLYLLGVIVVSLKCRRSAAILNALLSVTAFHYFILPIHDSFVLEDYSYLIPLVAMSAVALVISTLTYKTREQAVAVAEERMRNALLNAVSHDIKTPLASIYGAATTLLEEEKRLLAHERADLVQTIADEAERLNRIVTNILEMTRLESGFKVTKDWQPLEEIIGAALNRLNSALGSRPVTVYIPGDLPMILVDDVLLEEVFTNILENVVKYTPPNTAVEITSEYSDGHITVLIRDHGPGFTAGDEERVFEKFYRGKTNGASGVGLGLAICRAVISSHGGVISAGNAASGGAVIRIDLPIGGVPPQLPLLPEGAAQ
jgi:two-component system, OmpR family, sensor histidine kinase KdpD